MLQFHIRSELRCWRKLVPTIVRLLVCDFASLLSPIEDDCQGGGQHATHWLLSSTLPCGCYAANGIGGCNPHAMAKQGLHGPRPRHRRALRGSGLIFWFPLYEPFCWFDIIQWSSRCIRTISA